jgi:hypothetical protein
VGSAARSLPKQLPGWLSTRPLLPTIDRAFAAKTPRLDRTVEWVRQAYGDNARKNAKTAEKLPQIDGD